MAPKRHLTVTDNTLDADSAGGIVQVQPVKRGRGRPPGSTNKNKTKDKDIDDEKSSTRVRTNPERWLKGKGGDVAHKVLISKVIDPTELKAQADAFAAAKSPIPSSAPLNPYAPASLKPVRKKVKKVPNTSTAGTSAYTTPAPDASTAFMTNELRTGPATFQNASGAPPNVPQAHRYPMYTHTLPTYDSTANVTTSVNGAPTMDGTMAMSATTTPSTFSMVTGTLPMTEFAMPTGASMMNGPAANDSNMSPRELQSSAAAPESSRYGFQPLSAEMAASESVGISAGLIMDTHALHPDDDPSTFGFDMNLPMDEDLSFLGKPADSSRSGDGTNTVNDIGGSYLTDTPLSWSQSPLDSVYVPNPSSVDLSNTYMYSQWTEQPQQPQQPQPEQFQPPQQPIQHMAYAHDSVVPREEDSQLSSHLQDEMFEIEEEGKEEETEDESDSDNGSESESESDSDSSDTDNEENKIPRKVSGKQRTSNYVAPARSPLSRPYAGTVVPSHATAASLKFEERASKEKSRSVSQISFIGNEQTNSQSLDSFSVGGAAKRKRKPRSNVTAALLRYGSTHMQSPSPSPAPSSTFSHKSHKDTLSMPGLTPTPSLVSERASVSPVITHEDRSFYCEEYQKVYDYARDLCRLSYALENAFPECPRLFKEEPEVKLQDILVDCVDRAIAHFGLQDDLFLQKHKFGIALGISKDQSTFRGDVKTYARKAVASLLSIRKELQKKKKKKMKGNNSEDEDEDDDEPISPIIQKHRAEVIEKVKEYFKDDKYLLGGTDEFGNYINYGSEVIQKVINDVFYSHDQKLGFLFESEFKKEVPKRVVALVASAIQCALMEYKKHGYLRTLRFDPKDFAKRYRRHVRGIERLEKVGFHKKLFRRERKRWAGAHWLNKETVNGIVVDDEQEEPPVHLRLEYYLPPGVEMSDSEAE